MLEENLDPSDEPSGTLFVNDIDRIDCALFDPSIGIVGQSWFVDVEITGSLDENGFVYDFSHLKKLVKAVLKNSLDHALLIPIMSTHVHYQESNQGEIWNLKAKTKLTGACSDWEYKCPKGAVYPVRTIKVTKEVLEQECAKLIRHRLPPTIQRVAVNLRPESSKATDAFFRYTHGITNHEGLCQRLFHGHRSRIEVEVAGERRHDLEQFIAHDIFGSIVHVASLNQVIESSVELQPRKKAKEIFPVRLSFEGSLGHYEACVPSNRLFLVAEETSIEFIARELAVLIAEKTQLQSGIRVRCFEGIGKGAVAEL